MMDKCGACEREFETLAEVFSHDCIACDAMFLAGRRPLSEYVRQLLSEVDDCEDVREMLNKHREAKTLNNIVLAEAIFTLRERKNGQVSAQ